MTNLIHVDIYCDGSCTPNPNGVAVSAFVVESNDMPGLNKVYRGEYTSDEINTQTSNNVAEWIAVTNAAYHARTLTRLDQEIAVRIKTDSELVVKQAKGHYKTRDLILGELKKAFDSLVSDIRSSGGTVSIEHVPRSLNKADAYTRPRGLIDYNDKNTEQ